MLVNLRRIFALFVLCFAARATAAVHEVDYFSDPGDPIGGGRTERVYLLAPGIAAGNPHLVLASGPGLEGESEEFWFRSPTLWVTGEDDQGAIQLSVNTPFSNSIRPGLSVGSQNSTCTTAETGWFRVLAAAFDSSGNATTLAIDFVTHCEGATGSLYGALRFNSNIPIALQKPHAIAGPPTQAFAGSTVIVDGHRSFEYPSAPLTYSWTQVAGTPATITGADTAIPTISIPASASAGLVFQLKVTDASGLSDTSLTGVVIADRSATNYAIFDGAPGEQTIGDLAFEFQPFDTDYPAAINTDLTRYNRPLNYAGDVQAFRDGPWSFLLQAGAGQSLAVGSYPNASYVYSSGAQPQFDIGPYPGCTEQSMTGGFDVLQLASSGSSFGKLAAHVAWGCNSEARPLNVFLCDGCDGTKIPIANAGGAQSVPAQGQVSLDASSSSDPLGGALSYNWRQIGGTPVVLSDRSAARPAFTAPASGGTAPLRFSVVVSTSAGYMAMAETSVAVGAASNTGGGGGSEAPDALLLLLTAGLLNRRRRSHPGGPERS